MRKVAVLFGGRSCENEISVLTAVFVMRLLDRTKYTVVPVYIHLDGGMYSSEKMFDLDVFREKQLGGFERVFFDGGRMYLRKQGKKKIRDAGKIDVALNCCHGGLGEGGGVSALMEWNDIPLASPDLTSSGIFMDKSMTKLVVKGLGVPTLDYLRVNEEDYQKRGRFLLRSIESRLKYPVVVKPAHLGSSIGISVAKNEGEVQAALEAAFRLDDRVIVEKYLTDKQDVNCAAYMLGGEIVVSEPERAFGEGIYTFEEKYIKKRADESGGNWVKGKGRYALNGDIRAKIRSYTKTLYKRLNLRGVVRMDFLLSGGEAYLCEVNTVPGSLAYYFFCERVTDARRFFGDLIEEALREGEKAKKQVPTTGILTTVRWQKK